MDKIQNKKIYDLEERTALFGEMVIKFTKGLPNNLINRPIISQLIRSATSIGANYMEANGAESKKILSTRYIFAKKKQRKQCIGLE